MFYVSMTVNYTEFFSKQNIKLNIDCLSLIQKYEIDFLNFPVISDVDVELSLADKAIIIDKLLQAHNLAKINVQAGNITNRGFASNICTKDGIWGLGTNFNNTRNDISSVCGERSAILCAYNNALINFAKDNNQEKVFDFKIKYICMAQDIDLNKITTSAVPCEDCLSWINTNRFFDDETYIFSFEKNHQGELALRITTMMELLPYKNVLTSNKFDLSKEIKITKSAQKSIEKNNIQQETLLNLLKKAYENYSNNNLAQISNQNIACSILANDEIFIAKKVDYSKRWFSDVLELASYKAIEKYQDITNIQAIAYFGDEIINDKSKLNDGVVSLKALGRIRQKYATNETLLVLNLSDKIIITTIGGYLPKKFIQGYKIV